MTDPADPLVDSIVEAAARLKVSRTQIFTEIRAGRLDRMKVGRRTLISRAAQARWVASHEASATSDAA